MQDGFWWCLWSGGALAMFLGEGIFFLLIAVIFPTETPFFLWRVGGPPVSKENNPVQLLVYSANG